MNPDETMWLEFFRTNWHRRHDSRADWRKRHRHFARQAIGEIRYLRNKPRKWQGPTHYGHGG